MSYLTVRKLSEFISIRPYILGTAYRVKRYRPGTWFIVGDCTVKEEEEGSMKPVYGATPPLALGLMVQQILWRRFQKAARIRRPRYRAEFVA